MGCKGQRSGIGGRASRKEKEVKDQVPLGNSVWEIPTHTSMHPQ